MQIVDNGKLSHAAIPGIDHVTLAGSDQGLSQLSVWQQRMDPGQATPPHRHDCEEVVICNAGRGRIEVEGRSLSFGADCTLVIPRNVMHQIFNDGDLPLVTTAIFSTSPVDVRAPDGSPMQLPWRS
jgi:mannose-6-phosphate isomerase-like protein (cupin superfamily)